MDNFDLSSHQYESDVSSVGYVEKGQRRYDPRESEGEYPKTTKKYATEESDGEIGAESVDEISIGEIRYPGTIG